uniref:Uncharacterized protein n=1 Tax=viral metagenome TaxID=1070528 RepID=A0A6C0DRJ2_9ZZZZ
MSQGDYIRYKRISTELKYDTLPPVLSEQQYINFTQYSIENNVVSLKPDYRIPATYGTIKIFDMNKTVLFCPTFLTCTGTDARPNRIPMSTVYFTPQYVKKYVKQPGNAKTGCNCILNSVNTNKNICKCKTEY